MTGDPSTWQPGDFIVNRTGEMFTLDHRGTSRGNVEGWHADPNPADRYCWTFISDAELADQWQPLTDVIERGWQQREEVGVDYCLVHDGIRNEDDHRCDFAAHDDECDEDGEPRACRLVPMYHDIPEGEPT